MRKPKAGIARRSRSIQVPRELAGLYRFLGGHLPISESFDLAGFTEARQDYNSYLSDLYNEWFPKARPCADEYIAQWVFRNAVNVNDLKTYEKCILLGLTRSSERIATSVASLWRNHGHTSDAFAVELALLKEVAFEAVLVVDEAYRVVEKRAGSFGWGRRNIVHSWEDFSATRDLLRAHVTAGSLGQFAVRPASVMLLRQALEKRIKYALGVWAVTDGQGNDLRTPGRAFIELLRKAPMGAIELPIPVHSFVRLYKWANRYVHGGQRPHVWEMETALHILRPLFSGATTSGGWSQSGAIRISLSYYAQVPDLLVRMLKRTHDTVKVYRLDHPESEFM